MSLPFWAIGFYGRADVLTHSHPFSPLSGK